MEKKLKNVENAFAKWKKTVKARDEAWDEVKKHSEVLEKIRKKRI